MACNKNLLIVFGARVETSKMIPLIKKLKNCESVFETKVCVTAQRHRDMLDQVLGILYRSRF